MKLTDLMESGTSIKSPSRYKLGNTYKEPIENAIDDLGYAGGMINALQEFFHSNPIENVVNMIDDTADATDLGKILKKMQNALVDLDDYRELFDKQLRNY